VQRRGFYGNRLNLSTLINSHLRNYPLIFYEDMILLNSIGHARKSINDYVCVCVDVSVWPIDRGSQLTM
jgi:hypothetical protein